MTTPAYLTWENFRSAVIVPGQQRVHRIASAPLVEVYSDGARNEVGLWIEVPPDTAVPAEHLGLTMIAVRTAYINGRWLLEAKTESVSLRRQFYHFAVAVAERVIVERLAPTDAVGLELNCFADLLEARPVLGIERQIGLIGELLFLSLLLERFGVGALDSWLGPAGEPHDFRVQSAEFEVKTTTATKRIHTIHGTEQLVPSKSCSLNLISVLLGPPGAGIGFSLGDVVEKLSGQFAAEPVMLAEFNSKLASAGYRPEDSIHYSRKFVMRRPLALIPIDSTFPAITRPGIQNLLGSNAIRIEFLSFDVNVDGLEHEKGSADFEAAFKT
ncbi:MAG: PD-(D/E)XK motif protein [Massilia sp.]